MGAIEKRRLDSLERQNSLLKAVINKFPVREGIAFKKGGGAAPPGANLKLFAVGAESDGDEVYWCHELQVDSTYWTDENANDKLLTKKETIFTADVDTDKLTVAAAQFEDGDEVVVRSEGTLPAPLAAATRYFVRDVSDNDLKLSATSGGDAINITSIGIGTHYIMPVYEVLNLWATVPEEPGIHSLETGDRLAGFDVTDDEGIKRWCGIPLEQPETETILKLATATEDALSAGVDLSCTIEGETGTQQVYCLKMGSGAPSPDPWASWELLVPRAHTGDVFVVYKNSVHDKWVAVAAPFFGYGYGLRWIHNPGTGDEDHALKFEPCDVFWVCGSECG